MFLTFRITSPRLGANINEIRNRNSAVTTIHGPVGIAGASPLITVPPTPDRAPTPAAIMIMIPSDSVQYRPAAAGMISMDAISTTPTACKPTVMVITISVAIKNSMRFTGYPIDLANSGSKLTIFISLYETATASSMIRLSVPNTCTSPGISDAAFPNRNASRPL